MHKFSIIILFSLFSLLNLKAQSDITPANMLATSWSSKYQLDEPQQAKALKIAQSKHEQLESISTLMSTNPDKYYAKLDALQKGTLKSLERILNSEEQLKIYRATLAETRAKRAELKQKLQKEGSSKAEIKRQLVSIHAE